MFLFGKVFALHLSIAQNVAEKYPYIFFPVSPGYFECPNLLYGSDALRGRTSGGQYDVIFILLAPGCPMAAEGLRLDFVPPSQTLSLYLGPPLPSPRFVLKNYCGLVSLFEELLPRNLRNHFHFHSFGCRLKTV